MSEVAQPRGPIYFMIIVGTVLTIGGFTAKSWLYPVLQKQAIEYSIENNLTAEDSHACPICQKIHYDY